MVQLRLKTRFVSLAFVGMVVLAPFAQAAFSDVQSGSEFAQYINDLSAKGVISSGSYFYPRVNLTRGELAKILVKAANLTINNSGGQRFPDVPTSHTFFDYVATLSNRGTIRGYDDGSFRPNGNVSRGEFAKMVVGSFGFNINSNSEAHFSYDVPMGSTFYSFVETLYHRDVVSGYNGTINFGVNDPVTREQAAKIVSLAMQSAAGTLAPRNASGAIVSRDIPLTFTPNLPRLTLTPNAERDEIVLNPVRFPYLAGGSMYELWLKDTAGEHSAGKFNVRNNNVVDSRGIGISSTFNVPVAWSGVTNITVTIEPARDADATPARTVIVKGVPSQTTGAFDVDFPVGISGATARAFITKGFSGQDNVLNLDFTQLADLRPVGWNYEAWYEIGGQAQTAGTFVANGSHTAFKSTDLPSDLMRATAIRVSIEPNPDDSSAPSGIIPWNGTASGVSTSTSTSTVTSTSTPTTTTSAQDTELYKGLTTSMTAQSIRARTVTKTEGGVTIQAYAASPILADNEEQSIIIKVSDATGNPIGDLDLSLSRVEGPTARLTDPREIGNNSGIYIGKYDVDGTTTTNSDAVIRIRAESSGSSSSTTAASIPTIDLGFEISSSSRIGSPRVMEVDVTRTKLVVDENSSTLRDADMIVLVNVLDSNRRSISSVLSSGVSLFSDNSSRTPTGTVSDNIKYFTLDDRFFSIDDEDNDITTNRNFTVQLIPGTSDSFDPIISEQYRVQAQFKARTSTR